MFERTHPDPSTAVSVLVVSPHPEDHRAMAAILEHSNWRLHSAGSCREALGVLARAPVQVVVTEAELPDGRWQALENIAHDFGSPRLLVASRRADDVMWSEVLNDGGYDCLSKPFAADEVLRSVSLAWRSWRQEHCRTAAAAASVA